MKNYRSENCEAIRGFSMTEFNDAFTEIEGLLLKAYHGEEDDADGGNEDLGDP